MRHAPRTVLFLAAATLLLAAPGAHAQDAKPLPKRPPVVVIGFDGLAADRTERLMEEQKLPNLAKLHYARLATSNPAQSPVAWASIISGLNSGGTGIYDFVRRVGDNPANLDFAHAERGSAELLPAGGREAVIVGIAAAGGVLALVFAFLLGIRWPLWRKGKRLEILLSGGAALGALGALVVHRWVPDRMPTAKSLRDGVPMWISADRAGLRAIALEAPLCLPPDPMQHGCCLVGLGVPDMSASWGDFYVWSDDPKLPGTTETAGYGMYVRPGAGGAFDLVLPGPPDPFLTRDREIEIGRREQRMKSLREVSYDWPLEKRRAHETEQVLVKKETQLRVTLPVVVRRGSGATVTLQDGTQVALQPGEWSELLPIHFEASPLVKPRGRVRLNLYDAGSDQPIRPFRLFVQQVQWDAAHVPPAMKLSEPPSFAKELEAAIGPFETIGWPEMTNPVKDDFLDDESFIRHIRLVMKQREAKLYHRLRKKDFDLLFTLFAEPDRVQHAFYRHVDDKSPTHDKELAKKYGPEVDAIYVEADRIVGEAVKLAGEDAIVMVVSDHGFAPFRRGVNLNMFLASKLWQAATREGETESVPDIGTKTFYGNLDWKRTKAYSTGLGSIYLNLQGREPYGTVKQSEAAAVVDAIAKDLLALRDEDGTQVIRKVYKGSEIYKGARLREAPDIVVGFEWGYRCSWQSTLGGRDQAIITPNKLRWSGDHCSVDPELVAGVMFCSRPIAKDAKPTVEDVAPSVLGLLGIAAPSDGKNVLR